MPTDAERLQGMAEGERMCVRQYPVGSERWAERGAYALALERAAKVLDILTPEVLDAMGWYRGNVEELKVVRRAGLALREVLR